MLITGSYNKINGYFKMHKPNFPYDTIVYAGYNLKEMQRKYRADFGLKYKHIEWIII